MGQCIKMSSYVKRTGAKIWGQPPWGQPLLGPTAVGPTAVGPTAVGPSAVGPKAGLPCFRYDLYLITQKFSSNLIYSFI